MTQTCARESPDWILGKKIPHWERGETMQKAPWGSDHSPKPVGVQEAFQQCSCIYMV